MNNTVNDYRIIVSGSAYTAPELRRFHLQGRLSNGEHMTSSPIVLVRGRVVTTRSGSRYTLGKRAEGCKTFADVRRENPGVPMG